MKTLTYITAIMALIIPVMVNAQTYGNRDRKIRIDIMGQKSSGKMDTMRNEESAIKLFAQKIEASELSARNSIQKFNTNQNAILFMFSNISHESMIYHKGQISFSDAKLLMRRAVEIRQEARNLASLPAKYGAMTNAEEKETLALLKQEEIFILFKKEVPALMEQVDSGQIKNEYDPIIFIQQLREASLSALPNEKQMLLNEAKEQEEAYLTAQIQLSNASANLCYQQFNRNKITIQSMLEQIKDKTDLVGRVMILSVEADLILKSGMEIREEANAQLHLAARLGEQSNAKEKETIAIAKQTACLALLDHSNSEISYVIK